jgi:diguanylate cyclase (GGDEF)-like protein
VTLARQLLLIICALFVLLFVGTLTITVINTRSYLDAQMHSHAEDTATSLGLSLEPALQKHDVPLMETMVNAIFDPGYYREITIRNPDGSVLIEKELPVRIYGVPQWFIHLIPLKGPSAERELSAGWNLAGTITVRSHPGYAYRELWAVAMDTFWWFLAVFFAVLVLLFVSLRFVLHPLRAVEDQALAICDRQFPVQKKIPRTRELNRVVTAMNRMTRKVETMLADQTELTENMRRQANEDSLTGLANRRSFDARLNALIASRETFMTGALFLCQINDFKGYNERHGFEKGDEFLKELAGVLRGVFAEETDSILCRLGGANFAVVVRDIDQAVAGRLGESLSSELGRLQSRGYNDAVDVGRTGIAYYQGEGTVSELLSRADMALRAAARRGTNAWSLYDENTVARSDVHTASEWLARLRDVIDNRRIILHYQPVKQCRDGSVVHYEVLARIAGREGEALPAGIFIPMAERHGLGPAFDRLVVSSALERLDATGGGATLAVNLSPVSVHDAAFVEWLNERLGRDPARAGRLVLEAPEYGVMSDQEATAAFLDRLASSPVRFGLDHFGLGAVSFGYLKRFKLAYIKIDGSYIRGIDATTDNQFLVQSVADIAHGLDIQVIAESVETGSEWDMLERLHVDAGQGYFVGRPSESLEDSAD